MGHFKESYRPHRRGFTLSTGMLSGASDHYTHMIEEGYDWHLLQHADGSGGGPNFAAKGRESRWAHSSAGKT